MGDNSSQLTLGNLLNISTGISKISWKLEYFIYYEPTSHEIHSKARHLYSIFYDSTFIFIWIIVRWDTIFSLDYKTNAYTIIKDYYHPIYILKSIPILGL